jgi:hypothetical protein
VPTTEYDLKARMHELSSKAAELNDPALKTAYAPACSPRLVPYVVTGLVDWRFRAPYPPAGKGYASPLIAMKYGDRTYACRLGPTPAQLTYVIQTDLIEPNPYRFG